MALVPLLNWIAPPLTPYPFCRVRLSMAKVIPGLVVKIPAVLVPSMIVFAAVPPAYALAMMMMLFETVIPFWL